MNTLGRLLRKRRLALGLTQVQLEERTDLSQHYISQVELGKVKLPGDGVLRKFAHGLDLSWEDVFIAAGRAIRIDAGDADHIAHIPDQGRVPADAVRYCEFGERGLTVEVPADWLPASSSCLAVRASGDCLASRGIHDGDYVVLRTDVAVDAVRDGTIVLVRVGDEYTLKAWHRGRAGVELRDGDGRVVHMVTEGHDYQLIGTYVLRFDRPDLAT